MERAPRPTRDPPARTPAAEPSRAAYKGAYAVDRSRRGDEMRALVQMTRSGPSPYAPRESAASGRRDIVQRMVALATPNLSAEKDTLVLNNLDYALGHFGGPVGDMQSNRKFDQAKAGDRVALVAHGAPGYIGLDPQYDAQDVADALTTPPAIRKDLSSIVLYSCNAGMDEKDARNPGTNPSLVDGVSKALADKGYHIGVEGQKGVAFGFKGIGERTTQGDEKTGDDAWFPRLHKLLGSPKYQKWEKAPNKGFKPADEVLKAENYQDSVVSGMTLEEKAKAISDILAPFWRDIEAEVGGDLYDHLKGWIRVTRFAGGGELVQDSR